VVQIRRLSVDCSASFAAWVGRGFAKSRKIKVFRMAQALHSFEHG
jgi:hypothetical protein